MTTEGTEGRRAATSAIRALGAVALLAMLLGLAAGPAWSEEDESRSPEKMLAAAKPNHDSFVRVEVDLRYDRGEEPTLIGARPSFSITDEDGETLIKEKRPFELAGLLLGPKTVLTGDLTLHPRFVSGWRVLFRGASVTARPVAWARDRAVLYLELDAPLEGARPLVFNASAQGPWYGVQYVCRDTEWGWDVGQALGVTSIGQESGRVTAWTWPGVLIVAKDGTPVGVADWAAIDYGSKWRGSPLDWPQHDLAAVGRLRQAQERAAVQGLLSVHLSLRSPRTGTGGADMMSSRRRQEGEGETERDVAGVLLGERTLLVLSELEPHETARLERIQVRPEGGDAVAASFAHSLRDYGAFVATLDAPLPGALQLAQRPVRSYRKEFVLDTHLRIRGEQRIVYHGHARIPGVSLSWERQIVPTLHGSEDHYLFDTEGRLLAVPITRRAKETERESWRRGGDTVMLPAEYVRPLMEDPAAHADGSNVPLSADEENRLAWLGVELQDLTPELARVNNVSHLTDDGNIGAIVSYVYGGSPAEKAGIEAGGILIRVHADSLPKPFPIRNDSNAMGRFGDIFEHLAPEMEEFFERMPGFSPWPKVDNPLHRQLTELGFGKPFEVEVAEDGKAKRLSFKVEEGPPHYQSALSYKHAGLGLTVRDLTYEVRRYLQLEPDAPGVIISKLEQGEKAAVAGLARFELISHVNDQAIADVKAFEAALAEGGEVRLKLKRRDKERIVRIQP